MEIGDKFGGGVIFYLDETGENGLVAYPNDLGLNHWSESSSNSTNPIGELIGHGKLNTQSILTSLGEGVYAAKVCSELEDGQWYLPSLQELQLMLVYQEQIGNTGRYYQRLTSNEASLTKVKTVDFSPRHSSPLLELNKKQQGGQGNYFRPVRTIGFVTPVDISTLTLPEKPSATLVKVGNPSETSVTLKATYLTDGSSPIINKGILFNKIGNPFFGNISETKPSDTLNLGEENVTITGLIGGVKYYLSTYATNAYGTHYSEPIEITTAGDPINLLVFTDPATNITNTSVILNGRCQLISNSGFLAMGFEISTNEFMQGSTVINVDPATGSFIKKASELIRNTRYYFRFFADSYDPYNPDFIFYQKGEILEFLTGDFTPIPSRFHPHVITWTTPSAEATEDPETGYPIPGTAGESKESPCRFHPRSNKMVKNEDSTESLQVGKIRFPLGAEIPHLFAMVTVKRASETVYKGLSKTRNVGQLSGGWIEV